MSKDILEEIIAHKRIEIAGQEKVVSAAFLEKQLGEPPCGCSTNPPCLSTGRSRGSLNSDR